jgi:hypothetical protein
MGVEAAYGEQKDFRGADELRLGRQPDLVVDAPPLEESVRSLLQPEDAAGPDGECVEQLRVDPHELLLLLVDPGAAGDPLQDLSTLGLRAEAGTGAERDENRASSFEHLPPRHLDVVHLKELFDDLPLLAEVFLLLQLAPARFFRRLVLASEAPPLRTFVVFAVRLGEILRVDGLAVDFHEAPVDPAGLLARVNLVDLGLAALDPALAVELRLDVLFVERVLGHQALIAPQGVPHRLQEGTGRRKRRRGDRVGAARCRGDRREGQEEKGDRGRPDPAFPGHRRRKPRERPLHSPARGAPEAMGGPASRHASPPSGP